MGSRLWRHAFNATRASSWSTSTTRPLRRTHPTLTITSNHEKSAGGRPFGLAARLSLEDDVFGLKLSSYSDLDVAVRPAVSRDLEKALD